MAREKRVWCLLYFDDNHGSEPEVVGVYASKKKAEQALEVCKSIAEIRGGEMAEDCYWLQQSELAG